MFAEIAKAMGKGSAEEAIEWYEQLIERMGITGPVPRDRDAELEVLATSVNVERLTNNPISLDTNALYELYGDILKNEN